MAPWLQGIILVLSLVVGIGVGWTVGRKIDLRMPNAWVTALVLAAGSLGGPVVTYKTMGPVMPSFILALIICGFCSGLILWPMGEKHGEEEWQ